MSPATIPAQRSTYFINKAFLSSASFLEISHFIKIATPTIGRVKRSISDLRRYAMIIKTTAII